MSLNRRKFLKQVTILTGALATSKWLSASARHEEKHKLTILHTNDVHSRLEPFAVDAGKYAGMGGVAERAVVIEKIRQQEEQVLLLDAGDIFQGTPYFNMFNGEPEIKAMSMMKYDATTLGNHDFDKGMENFLTQIKKHANFPVVNCNYDFRYTPLENQIIPYHIIQKGATKVGILGVGIELQGLVPENLYGKTTYNDPIKCANETADLLHKKGCDLIICLSHLGDKYFDQKVSDEMLAKETFDIDLIIGGHTHRFFDKPKIYRNKKGNDTIVNQVGFAGINLGKLDYVFSSDSRKKLHQSHKIDIVEKSK